MTLAFDPRGKLYVGSITEPGWMAQPDRGALFRIDYTGQVPFEMQSIHVRPHGFRIVFTSPVDRKTAEKIDSYRLEHYRYEYTGAYGSPELDRTAMKVERVEVSADGRSVDLTTAPLVKDRVYMISANGVRSAKGEKLVHPTGAYTLNEVPRESRLRSARVITQWPRRGGKTPSRINSARCMTRWSALISRTEMVARPTEVRPIRMGPSQRKWRLHFWRRG